ncbi:hypothetical protein M885DRAFT_622799 [Pelagophyceae sp. CCMP2097]|nr:hypothetical protein M885DRAFT_622799 [Pelagophyceae sp. CCMP2097]
MAEMSYDLDSDNLLEVRASPASQVADELDRLKAAGNDFVAKQQWELAAAQYERAVEVADVSKETLSGDFEAERRAERTVLACLSNQALCALKGLRFEKCKDIVALALEFQSSKVRQPDSSTRAKLLFRRAQASLGLGHGRVAIDALTEAIDLEEKSLGVSNKAAVFKADAAAEKQRMASILAMKRELLKARKMDKEESRAANAKFSGAKGFLTQGKKGFTDAKEERKQDIERRINAALDACYDGTEDPAALDKHIEGLVAVGLAATASRDEMNELHAMFAEGFIGFIAGETTSDAGAKEAYAAASSVAFEGYWHLRATLGAAGFSAEALQPPLQLSDVAAREATALGLMRTQALAEARPHLLEYIRLATESGPLQAYHNLPDSFLMQRGMPKMDAKQRRAWRWKHRSHSPRALFDGYTALAAVAQQSNEKQLALGYAQKSLDIATEDEERAIAHRNLAMLVGGKWRTPGVVDDDSEAQDEVAATPDEKLEAARHVQLAADFEQAVEDTKEKEAANTKTMGDGDALLDGDAEELPDAAPPQTEALAE